MVFVPPDYKMHSRRPRTDQDRTRARQNACSGEVTQSNLFQRSLVFVGFLDLRNYDELKTSFWRISANHSGVPRYDPH